jgi:hypothetical protein
VPRRAAPSLALLAACVVASGCTCRPGTSGAPPERFLPADVELALIVPEAGRAARELATLHALVAGFPGASDLASARGALAAQLGFDPLDPEALAGAGIEPRRGAALARWRRPGAGGAPTTAQLVVLPVRSADALDALVTRVARDRLGAGLREREDHGGHPVDVFRPAPGTPATLAYAVVDGSALVAPGPAGPDLVAEAAARTADASLGASAAFRTARAALGDRYAAMMLVPPGSRRLDGLWMVKDGLAVGTSADGGGVRLGAAVLLDAREPSFRALAAAGKARALVARLDPSAPLVATWDGDPAALGRKLVPLFPRTEPARLAARGLEPQRDLFDPLAPGAAVALSLAPDLQVTALSEEAFRYDPLRLLRFEAVLPLRDPDAALAASERLVRAPAPRRGTPPPAGPRVFRLPTAHGEIAWIVDAEARRLVGAGGAPGALDAVRERLARGGTGFEAPTKAAGDALEGGLGGAVVDVQKLVKAVRALPDETYGEGPTAFVMRSVVDRFVEPAARLAAVSVEGELASGALVVHVALEARGSER